MRAEDIYIRDPFIYTEDGVAYLIGTTDENAWGGKAKGFLGYKSTDLVNFEGPFVLFEADKDFWADENFWAPELHKYKGKYYIFASFKSKDRRRASQALVSDAPFGKYVPLGKPFTPPEWECLDATLYEENDAAYTVFCHEWVQCADGEMCLGKFGGGFDKLAGSPEVLFCASEAPWTVGYEGSNYITDGPFLYRLKSGKLLMLWSSLGKDGYAMGMSVSENGIKGPWKHLKEPLFGANGGHGMVFCFKGKLYVSLHCPNQPHMSERPRFYEAEEREDRLVLKNDKESV